MNKKLVVFFIFCSTIFSAEAGYVRKLKEPDFFIPAQDRMHKPEKLPKIRPLKPKKIVKKEQFSEIPEYKTKYNKYLADLAVFANTKIMKENAEVEKDLSSMQSGDIFDVELTVSQRITTKEQKEFYSLAAKILND